MYQPRWRVLNCLCASLSDPRVPLIHVSDPRVPLIHYSPLPGHKDYPNPCGRQPVRETSLLQSNPCGSYVSSSILRQQQGFESTLELKAMRVETACPDMCGTIRCPGPEEYDPVSVRLCVSIQVSLKVCFSQPQARWIDVVGRQAVHSVSPRAHALIYTAATLCEAHYYAPSSSL